MRAKQGASMRHGLRRRRPVRHPLRRLVLRSLVVAVCLAVTAVAVGYRLYVRPRVDAISSAEPADAVLALGGDARGAWDAERLVQQGFAKTLVLSDSYQPPGPMSSFCDRPPQPTRIICFVPSPSTTQGEAQQLGRMARANGWKRVIVMAPAFHVSRARMIMRRCYPGQLEMVPFPQTYPQKLWAYEFAYQTGAFGKALLVKRGC